MLGVTEGPLFDLIDHSMLTANNAVHQRRRSPFTRLFAARMIAEMRPRIRRTSDELIDAWYADGSVEFVGRFAADLPARTISGLLGLPETDIPAFTRLVYEVTRFFSLSFTPEQIPQCQTAAGDLRDYVDRTLRDRRRAPGEDFLSGFLAAADEAGILSPVEVIYQIMLLIVGGTDTTRVAIVAQVALLLQHRAQWDAVCGDPGLIPAAVSEALRFEPSVASSGRIAAEDIEIDGIPIEAGSLVSLSTMSAMRDEAAYLHPDVFDIRRTDQPRVHPIFGAGVHRCLGEALARAELEEALAALTARIPRLRLDEAPAIQGHAAVRRVDTMRLSWPT